MIDWYYHDPGEGRVGPYPADELRRRFRDRRLQHDTLVWHAGLREWQPLHRMAEELQLDMALDKAPPSVPQPPPLPRSAPGALPPRAEAPWAASRRASQGKYTRAPLRSKKTLSTPAIAGIAIAVVAIPAVLVLASVALPAYRDYAARADSVGSITGASIALKRIVGEYAQRSGQCLRNEDPRVGQMRAQMRQRHGMDVSFGALDGGCLFSLTFHAPGKPIDRKTLRYEGYAEGDAFLWDCSGGDLPSPYRPLECRND